MDFLQTILFLGANPDQTGRLRLDKELRDIAEGLQRAQRRDQLRLEQKWAVRPRDVQRAMLDVQPQIVHFSGHGAGEDGLIFEDDFGNSKLVNGDALASLFELFANQLKCVFLNGCYSEFQAKVISQHISYVIGMSKEIGDKAAITFAVGFYDALGAGRNVEFAFKLGCAAIQMEGIAEHLTPVLFKKPNNETTVPLTSIASASEKFPESPDLMEIFFSYAHEDETLRDELAKHLKLLERQKVIKGWHDRRITAGEEWKNAIDEHLESANIILLLISADFMASDYCYDIELKRAMERHELQEVRVIPVILRSVNWREASFGRLAALPTDGNPVTLWKDRDSAFSDIVQGIHRVVEFLGKEGQELEDISNDPKKEIKGSFITGNPIEHPKNFFGREKELKRLFNLLKTHPLQNAAIIGQRRSGKTSLLNYLRSITTIPAEQLRPDQKSDWLPNPQAYRWIFVDFQDVRMAQREGLLGFLLKSMGSPAPESCDLKQFMNQVSEQVHQPTVILMDEIGVALQRCPELDDEFWESLRALATNQTGGNLAFVLATPESPIDLAHNTGHSSPFFNIFGYTRTLEPLTEIEARELISSSPLPFAAADIDWMLTQSSRWPLLLQILCQERLFYLQEKDLSDNWQREGLEQIAKYLDLVKNL
jgi:hypothetical protein